MDYLIIALLALLCLLSIILLFKNKSRKGLDYSEDFDKIRTAMIEVNGQIKGQGQSVATIQKNLSDSLMKMQSAQSQSLQSMTREMTDSQLGLKRDMNTSILEMSKLVQERVDKMQSSNEKKLDEMRGVVSEKLDKTLNERLDTNFKQVGERLGALYKSLGELQSLSSGVSDLNKTLSNVKTRGTWGEVQLERILEQTMTPSQYEKNIATVPNSQDRVEFAIKFPSDDKDEPVYMPIDSKFPSDIYNKILEASEKANADVLNNATKELKNRILTEARSIRDKYIAPPNTTAYAVMFLPTEGLYAEALRINGLTEQCQSQMGVMIAGPTTITALLNALQQGFRNAALSRKSMEIMKLLEAINAQFSKLDDAVDSTQKKLDAAMKSNAKIQDRTRIMRKKMRNIGELPSAEANEVLGISDGLAEPEATDDF